MSQANVDVVKEAIAALNDRDADRYLALCTPDVELVSPLVAIEGRGSGPEGVRRFFAAMEEAASVFSIEVERLEIVDRARVLAFLELRFTSQRGIPLTQPIANVYDLSGERLRRIEVYLDREQALEAIGLPG